MPSRNLQRPNLSSQQSYSMPSTPHHTARKGLGSSRSPSPSDEIGLHSPRSVVSESHNRDRLTSQSTTICKYENISRITGRRRILYSIGDAPLDPPKQEPKQFLSRQENEQLTRRVLHIYKSQLLPTPESESRRKKFKQKLEIILKQSWPDAWFSIEIFGSSGNLLCTDESDVDVCIVTDKEDLETMHELAAVLDENGMEKVACIQARVRIVKIWDPELRLAADLNVNNTLALQNTKMIRTYVEVDNFKRVRPLIMLIKHWTKQRLLNDAAIGGTLSSYTWICMVLNFLQTRDPPILPSLHSRPHKPYVATADGVESGFDDNVEGLLGFGEDNVSTVGELLFQFFRYYGFEFNFDDHVVSVRRGCLLTRLEKGWQEGTKEGQSRLAVEEPFNPSRNLGNTADLTSMRGIHEELRIAFYHLCGLNVGKLFKEYEFPVEQAQPAKLSQTSAALQVSLRPPFSNDNGVRTSNANIRGLQNPHLHRSSNVTGPHRSNHLTNGAYRGSEYSTIQSVPYNPTRWHRDQNHIVQLGLGIHGHTRGHNSSPYTTRDTNTFPRLPRSPGLKGLGDGAYASSLAFPLMAGPRQTTADTTILRNSSSITSALLMNPSLTTQQSELDWRSTSKHHQANTRSKSQPAPQSLIESPILKLHTPSPQFSPIIPPLHNPIPLRGALAANANSYYTATGGGVINLPNPEMMTAESLGPRGKQIPSIQAASYFDAPSNNAIPYSPNLYSEPGKNQNFVGTESILPSSQESRPVRSLSPSFTSRRTGELRVIHPSSLVTERYNETHAQELSGNNRRQKFPTQSQQSMMNGQLIVRDSNYHTSSAEPNGIHKSLEMDRTFKSRKSRDHPSAGLTYGYTGEGILPSMETREVSGLRTHTMLPSRRQDISNRSVSSDVSDSHIGYSSLEARIKHTCTEDNGERNSEFLTHSSPALPSGESNIPNVVETQANLGEYLNETSAKDDSRISMQFGNRQPVVVNGNIVVGLAGFDGLPTPPTPANLRIAENPISLPVQQYAMSGQQLKQVNSPRLGEALIKHTHLPVMAKSRHGRSLDDAGLANQLPLQVSRNLQFDSTQARNRESVLPTPQSKLTTQTSHSSGQPIPSRLEDRKGG